MTIVCLKELNYRRKTLINSEIIINLEEHQVPRFSTSVLEKIYRSGDLKKDFNQPISINNVSLTEIRQNMGKKGIDLSKGNVKLESLLIESYIELGIYSIEGKESSDKVIYFIHGGGFVGGNFRQYDNQLKLLVEQTGISVVAINYRLAPENPYPSGLIDCKVGYDWIVKNSDRYGWNKKSIILLGDSAGVHLGLLLIVNRLKVLFLAIVNIYGCVDLMPEKNPKYHWSVDRYQICRDEKDILQSRLSKFSRQMLFFSKLYYPTGYGGEMELLDDRDYSRVTKMLYIEAEFDYFRWSNRYLIEKKLIHCSVDIINCNGVDHGFFERLGYCEETYEVIRLISDYLIALS